MPRSRTRVVWKEELPVQGGEHVVWWPLSAEVIHADMQDGLPCLWFLCDPNLVREERRFLLVDTGAEIQMPEFSDHPHVATFLLRGGLTVGHLFEIVPKVSGAPT